jgi:hypothetical protein
MATQISSLKDSNDAKDKALGAHTEKTEKQLNDLTIANQEMQQSNQELKASMAHLTKLLNSFVFGKTGTDQTSKSEHYDVTQSPLESQKLDSAKRPNTEPTPTSTPVTNKDPKRRNTSDSPSSDTEMVPACLATQFEIEAPAPTIPAKPPAKPNKTKQTRSHPGQGRQHEERGNV